MARVGAAMPPVSDGLVIRLRLHKEEKAQCGAQAKCLENEYSHTETPSIFMAERCVGTQQWGALERERVRRISASYSYCRLSSNAHQLSRSGRTSR